MISSSRTSSGRPLRTDQGKRAYFFGPSLLAGQSHMVDSENSPSPNGERPFDNRSGGPAPQAREGEGDEPLSCCRLTETGGGSSPSPSHRRGDGAPPLPQGGGENTCCRHMRLPCLEGEGRGGGAGGQVRQVSEK